MAIRVVAVSDKKRDPLIEVAEEWLARTDRRLAPELVLKKPRRKASDDAGVRKEEAAALLAASAGCTRVALDADGRAHDSPGFAKALERLLAAGKDVAFLVGGATGHDQAVRDVADQTWSLSALTFPHRLAVLVCCEQIYRAGEIARGGPYAK